MNINGGRDLHKEVKEEEEEGGGAWLGLGVEVNWDQENKLVKEGRWNAHNIT